MKDRRLYHSVAERLKKQIADGLYPAGSRLPGERDLAEQFKVSRVTIREAEIALQATGHISIRTGSGAYVLGPGEKAGGGVSNISAFELTEARLMFESEAAALAARQVSEETLAHLEGLLEIMSNRDSELEESSLRADREFRLAIAAASGNRQTVRRRVALGNPQRAA